VAEGELIMRTSHRAAAAAVATAALVAAGTSTAQAGTDDVKDKASDVIRYQDFDDENGTVLSYRDSIASGVDMRGMRLRHGKKSVSVNLKFAQLTRDTQVIVLFRLNNKVQPQRFLFSAGNREAILIGDEDPEETCDVPLKVKTGRKGTIHAVIDRSCFGDPVKIKATAVVSSSELDAEDGPYVDDYLSPTRTRGISWTTWLRAG
jgi:hypothetical protein